MEGTQPTIRLGSGNYRHDRSFNSLLDKDGLLRIIGGSAIVGGSGIAASFITSNFKI